MIEILTALASNMPLLNNLLLLGFFATFAAIFWKEHKDEKSPVNWIDLLMDDKKNKLSLSKLGHFWGIAISSWIVVYMVQQLTGVQIAAMFPWIFVIWLVFLFIATGIKSFSLSKDKLEVQNKEDKNAE